MKLRKRTWTAAGKKRVAYFMDYVDPLTGERKRDIIPGVTTQGDAQRFADDIWHDLNRKARLGQAAGPTKAERSLTLGQLLDWDSKRAGIRDRTRQSEATHRKPLERILGAGTPVLLITTSEVERFKSVREGEGKKPRTINLSLELLRACLNRAAREHLISRVSCEIRKLAETPPSIRFLSPAEVSAMIETRQGEERLILMLLAYLGLRPCDLWRLTWGDFDRNTQILYAMSYKRGASGGVKRSPLPVPPDLVAALDEQSSRLSKPALDCPIVAERPIEWLVRQSAKLAGIADFKRVTPYSLRHSFATNLLSSGVSVKDTQALMRHSNPALTLQRYCHEDMGNMRAAVERLANQKPARHKEGASDTEPKPDSQ